MEHFDRKGFSSENMDSLRQKGDAINAKLFSYELKLTSVMPKQFLYMFLKEGKKFIKNLKRKFFENV